MIWYGIEPLVTADIAAALELAVTSRLPLVRRYVARRVMDTAAPPLEQLVTVAIKHPNETLRLDLLLGMLDSLEGRGQQQAPPSWRALFGQLSSASDSALRAVAVRLAVQFGDPQAIARLRATVLHASTPVSERRQALAALLQADDGAPVAMLHRLVVEKSALRQEALRALIIRNTPDTAEVLLDAYAKFTTDEKRDAISVLATRRNFAAALLAAIEAGRVHRTDVSAYALQQLRAFPLPALQTQIATLWANDAPRLQKADEIARYKERMSAETLSHGDARAGRLVFQHSCAKCHALFGEGGTIAPDLTGSGRKQTDYVLHNLIDPNAEIDPAYRLTTVLTNDGRLLSGFMIQQDDRWLVMRTQDARVRLPLKQVEELATSNVSMMPEGMLHSFTDAQVRDLLVYLASAQQVPLPESTDPEGRD
jgi:putative heme-binding domain-containing protein